MVAFASQYALTTFHLPEVNEIKANTDGSSRGNPRRGGYGFVFRDHVGTLLDSKSVVEAFISHNFPWELQSKWSFLKSKMTITVTHTWREANFSCNDCAVR
ncbi:hypothetical protein GIB67_022947, partial [Kingdonia uniflora]